MAKKCTNCPSSCTDIISDQCVLYTGEAYECIDLEEGTFSDPVLYDEAFDKLLNGFCSFLENNNVALDCLYDNSGEPTVPVKEAVEKIIDKLCNLSTNDISSAAALYGIGNNSSVCGANLTNRYLNWAATNFAEGTKFTYNLSDALNNLPNNYEVGSVRVQATGKASGTVGTIIANSTNVAGGFNIAPNRFPVLVDVQATINTDCGIVTLRKKVSLTSNGQEGSYNTQLDVEDTSSTKGFGDLNLTQYLNNQSAQITYNKNSVDSLKDIDIADCENVRYPSRDIQTVVQTNSAAACEALFRLGRIGEEEVVGTDCDDQCGQNIITDTLQNILNIYGQRICQNQERIVALEQRIQELELTVAKCCDGAGTAGASSGSGGSSSGGGGCSGGNCPDGNFNSGGGTGFGGGGTITGNPNGGDGDGNGNPQGCTDSPITIDWDYVCTTGLSYTISGAVGGFTVTVNGQPAPVGTILEDGNHILKVVDGRNCSSSATININCCSIGLTATYDCENGLNAVISGGSGNTTITVDGSPYTQGMTLSEGAHTITVRDNTENCTESQIVNVDCETGGNPCDGVAITTSATSTNYCTTNSIDVTFSGGTGPYTVDVGGFIVNNVTSPTTVAASGFSNETVQVAVTDANGCTGITSVFVAPCCDENPVRVGSLIGNEFTCSGSDTHILNYAVTGGDRLYTIEIRDSGGNNLVTLTNQVPGVFNTDTGVGAADTYTIIATDTSNCSGQTLVTATACP